MRANHVSSPTNVYIMCFQFLTIAFNIDITHPFIDVKLHYQKGLDWLCKYRRIVSDVEKEFEESYLAIVYYHAPII